MAGQRTRIRFGAVSAEVLLEKTSTKPRGAQHETRRVLVEQASEQLRETGGFTSPEALTEGEVREVAAAATDPFGDPVAAPAMMPLGNAQARDDGREPEAEGEGLPPGLLGPMGDPTWPPPESDGPALDAPPVAFDSAEHEPQRQPVQAWPDGDPSRAEPFARGVNPPAEYVPPATRVEQGVHLETGEWVDLTERLAEVDARTKVDGLEVVRTIPASSYASERVRDAHYVAGVDPDTYKTLALLWRALRAESRAAEVRWTKRTAQTNGIIVARGELPSAGRPRPAVPAHLLLLELEWAANVKRVPPRVFGPVRAEVRADEVAAAIELVQSFAAPAPRVELRDERLAKRAELLELAREGRLAEYEPPAEPMPEDVDQGAEDLAAALALSAAWVREHAPA